MSLLHEMQLYSFQSGSFNTGLKDGWGLTNDGTHLIVTDSSDTLHWIDPTTFKKIRSLTIKDGDQALPWFNEVGDVWLGGSHV